MKLINWKMMPRLVLHLSMCLSCNGGVIRFNCISYSIFCLSVIVIWTLFGFVVIGLIEQDGDMSCDGC